MQKETIKKDHALVQKGEEFIKYGNTSATVQKLGKRL
jgi:hypothetical protein